MPGAVLYGPGDIGFENRETPKTGRTKHGGKSFMSAGRLRNSQKPALQLLAHPIGSQS